MSTQQDLYVPSGKNRFGEELMICSGMTHQIKISTDDTDGALFVFEHADMGKGGPPRHFHYEQDEWFYAIEGRATSPSRLARSGLRCAPAIRCSCPAWSRTSGRTSATTRGRCSCPSSPPVRSKRSSERVAR
jgi:hypothetical protein